MNLHELQAALARATAALTRLEALSEGIMAGARQQGRNTTPEENDQLATIHRQWEATSAERDGFRQEIQRAHVAAVGANQGNLEFVGGDYRPTPQPAPAGAYAPRAQLESAALRAIEAGGHGGALRPAAQDRLDRLVRDPADPAALAALYLAAVGSPDYEPAFARILSEPATAQYSMSAAELAAVRTVREAQRFMALGEGSGPSGAFAVPMQLGPTIIDTSDGALNPIRQFCRVFTISGRTWKGVASEGITGQYVPIGTEAGDNGPVLAQPEVSVEWAQAFVPVDMDLDMDWASLRTELARLFAEGRDVLEAEKFIHGAGPAANEPTGLVWGLSNLMFTGGAITDADSVYRLLEELPPRFQPRARFIANLYSLNVLRRLTGPGSTDEPALLNDAGDLLLRKPATEVSTMHDAELVVGDFAYFGIVDRIGLQVEVVPHLVGPARQYPIGRRGFYAYWRNSSVILNDNAFRGLSVGS